MKEIVRVAKDEKLIIICTIHQPSTKVYNGFDQVMILSKGREAFSGDKDDAILYFESIGFKCPLATNPAEFFLDLVSSDFSDETSVQRLLDTYEEHRARTSPHSSDLLQDNGKGGPSTSQAPRTKHFAREMTILFHRHSLLVLRDPILYIGRALAFLVTNSFFSFVYWNARPFEQSQVVNKLWICIWYCAVSTNREYLRNPSFLQSF
jgi:hypothetical protein